ncbi:hypothetical protein GCM10027174_27020 [Salinifilum aidingensis]
MKKGACDWDPGAEGHLRRNGGRDAARVRAQRIGVSWCRSGTRHQPPSGSAEVIGSVRAWRGQLAQDELVEHWTLIGDDLDRGAGKRGAAKLGFALLLKFFAARGRLPRPGGAVSCRRRRWSSWPSSCRFRLLIWVLRVVVAQHRAPPCGTP